MISAACMHEEEPRKYNTSIIPVNEAWLLTPEALPPPVRLDPMQPPPRRATAGPRQKKPVCCHRTKHI